MNLNMETRYNPKEFEEKIYKLWMDNNAFVADEKSDKEPFTIMMPPPNITGQLHLGHALNNTLQDVVIRYKRIAGFETLWLPGTDHASIATEVKVWQSMKNDGYIKENVSREEFLEKAWQWKEKYEARIIEQMKKLGTSCDWSRLRFTMDKNLSKVVTKVFVDLYNKGLIYKGLRLVNWCCDCETSLSDAEVEHIDKDSFFYHIKYKLVDSDEFLEIATTRPETLFGDTAVAVNPNDERYKKYIGKKIIVPIVNREVEIIADEYVSLDVGTGALKVTPAHDPNDFEIGKRHNLESISVIDLKGFLTEEATKDYEGLSREEARKKVANDLKEKDLLIKQVPYNHSVGVCYRCNNDIEPVLSEQWFVKMEELAKPALEALNKDLFIIPDRFDKIYTSWLENIKDWCISRQLWWGHRIPAWYHNVTGEIYVGENPPVDIENYTQDNDVLDTWFSSGLWPFSTLGWPEKTPDYNKFYPTSLLITAYDIIFFWVIRMVFSAIENTGEVPFKEVLIHGLVRDELGRKMSKSLDNGVDPLEVIDNYGADALRFMLMTGNTPGGDQRFIISRVENARNFANKLWNASRFVLMSVKSNNYNLNEVKNFTIADKWILYRLQEVKKEYQHYMDKYELGIAGDKLYSFIWDEYCDWYIELAKIRQYGEDEIAKNDVEIILVYVLKQILMLLHPFMPFITEEIYSKFNDNLLIKEIIDDYNFDINYNEFLNDVNNMQEIMSAIKSIRNARAEMNIPNNKKSRLFIKSTLNADVFLENKKYFSQLANVTDIIIINNKSDINEDIISCMTEKSELFIPSDDLIDYQKEFDRLNKERDKILSEIDRVVKKLANESFISKAPQKLVEEEKAKQEKFEIQLKNIDEQINNIKNKL